MKNNSTSTNNKIFSKYVDEKNSEDTNKSTNINILLNRVKSNQKNETRRKFYFSAAASTGLILFGLVVFS